MSRHNRQGVGNSNSFVCIRCKQDDCENCVDILRVIYTDATICKCKRKGHSGEAVEKQVKDPFDGTVYGPEATIGEDGEVKVNAGFRKWFREKFGN